MNDFFHADIFFFITSFGVIIFIMLGIIAFYHIIYILKKVRQITDRVEKQSRMVEEDLSDLRRNMKRGGRIIYLVTFIRRLFKKSE